MGKGFLARAREVAILPCVDGLLPQLETLVQEFRIHLGYPVTTDPFDPLHSWRP
jgi:hypothetical protein